MNTNLRPQDTDPSDIDHLFLDPDIMDFSEPLKQEITHRKHILGSVFRAKPKARRNDGKQIRTIEEPEVRMMMSATSVTHDDIHETEVLEEQKEEEIANIDALFSDQNAVDQVLDVPAKPSADVQSLIENLQGQEFGTDGWVVVKDSHPNVPLVLRRNIAGQQRDMVVVVGDGTIERYVRDGNGRHQNTQFLGNARELANHPDVLIGLMAQRVGDEVSNEWLGALGVTTSSTLQSEKPVVLTVKPGEEGMSFHGTYETGPDRQLGGLSYYTHKEQSGGARYDVPVGKEGLYTVDLAWYVHDNRNSNAVLIIQDGETVVGTYTVNEQVAPTEHLATVPIRSGILTVTMNNNGANGVTVYPHITARHTGDIQEDTTDTPLAKTPTEVQSLIENLQGQEFGTDGWVVVKDSHPNVPLVLRRNIAGQQRDMVVVVGDGTIERYVRDGNGRHQNTQFLGNARELANHPDVLIGLMAQRVGDEVSNEWLGALGMGTPVIQALKEYKDQVLRVGASGDILSLIGTEHIPENAISVMANFEWAVGERYNGAHAATDPRLNGVSFHGYREEDITREGNNLLVSSNGYRDPYITFDTPTYVHAFSLEQMAGGDTAWVRITYEDGSTYVEKIGRGGTFVINAKITKIFYDRGRSDAAFGFRDVLIAGKVEGPQTDNLESIDNLFSDPDVVTETLHIAPPEVKAVMQPLKEHKSQILKIGSSQEISTLIGSEYIPEDAISVMDRFNWEDGRSYNGSHSVNGVGVDGIAFHGYQEGVVTYDFSHLLVSDNGYRDPYVTFATPTYVHAFSLEQLAGGETARIRVTYADGTTFHQNVGRGGTFLINALVTKITYDRGHHESAFGIRDVLIAGENRVVQEVPKTSVPYSALYVSPNTQRGGVFDMQYMTNRDSVYFEVFLQGEPGVVYRQTAEHQGGIAHGQLSFDMRRVQGGRGNGKVEIRMFSDNTKAELLDMFTGRYERAGGIVSGQTNGEWGTLELGRTVENPIAPLLSIEKISGPNILVCYQSPYDSTEITLEGGGYFNTASISHEGGAGMGVEMLSFNADNRAGNYTLQMKEGRNGCVVSEVTFAWDPATKSLSLISENAEITTLQTDKTKQILQDKTHLFDKETSIESLSTSFSQLTDIFGRHLYAESSFNVDNDKAQEYVDKYWTGHPLDGYDVFIQYLDIYEYQVSALLRMAAQIAVTAMNGGSQKEAAELLQKCRDTAAAHPYIQKIGQFRISFPSYEDIRDEGIALMCSEYGVNMVTGMHAKNSSMLARDNYLAGGAGSGDITVEKTTRSQEAVDAQLRSIQEAYQGDPEGYEAAVKNYYSALEGGTTVVADEGVGGDDVEILLASAKNITEKTISQITNETDTNAADILNSKEVPNSDNTMIIVIYGSNQAPGDGSDFDNLLDNLRGDYKETWGFSPGYNPTEIGEIIGHSPSEAYQNIWDFIQKRIEANPQLKNITLIGHSWGGSMAYLLSKKINTELPNININSTTYVDAVQLLSTIPETRLPAGHGNVLNIYQSKVEIDTYFSEFTNGGTIQEDSGNRLVHQIDLDAAANNETHETIDLSSQPYILDFIRSQIQPM